MNDYKRRLKGRRGNEAPVGWRALPVGVVEQPEVASGREVPPPRLLHFLTVTSVSTKRVKLPFLDRFIRGGELIQLELRVY